jgi:hypothetical protein
MRFFRLVYYSTLLDLALLDTALLAGDFFTFFAFVLLCLFLLISNGIYLLL